MPKKNDSGGNRSFSVILLSLIALFIACLIIIGTLYVFISGKANPGGREVRGRNLFAQDSQKSVESSGIAVFADIGVLRAATADAEPVTIVISPFFLMTREIYRFRKNW
ncbi:hypothetical protein K7I13_09145 [Brucepastera parasyntrophica]|uniref:hypothetical protein n=1 Tax=Brucepastera parasyntrophica TaxID=2880008 RepID=UPI00210E2EC2|nr:hypothetical protein [Brucepastera parasyntrophica]ULQ58719.1 hypothetical protein K7I13_09145 [Brucepastera parasyntrophica]